MVANGEKHAVIRSNYLTPEGVKFYSESVKLYENLSNEFDFNIMYSQRGQLTLAHTDATVRAFRQRAEVTSILVVEPSSSIPQT